MQIIKSEISNITIDRTADIKKFIDIVNKTKYPVYAVRDNICVDAKSILGLMSIDPSQPFNIIYNPEDNEIILDLVFDKTTN